MRESAVGAVVAAGEAARVVAPVVDAARVVLFDFDGVLIRRDSFGLFIRDRYARSLLRKLAVLPTLPWLLASWPISWRLPVRTLVHVGLLGTGERGYRRAAEDFAATLTRRSRLFIGEGLQALRRHQQAGDRVVVVTGCEITLVRAILHDLGLRDLEVIGSRFRPGWLGMRVAEHNVGRAKVAALRARGIVAWRVAYSDSAQDLPMLRGAREPVLVNATPSLCKRVERGLGRSVGRVAWR